VRYASAAALAALVLASAATAAAPTPTRWIDKKDGFSIVLPPKWYPVPRTTAAVKQTIAVLKKQKKTGLANAYSFYLTAFGKTQLKAFAFQAFLDISPSNDPIVPQVAVQVSKATKPYKASDLAAAGRTYAASLAQNKGAKVTAPKQISLAEGPAQFITGTVPAGSGLADGFELYLLVHGGKLYVLKFDIDAVALAQAKVFRSIAENFRFL
jgi:hypothetical protein